MSEQEELKPLLGSVLPSQPVAVAPAPEPVAVEPEPVKVEAKKENKAPKVSTEGDKLVFLSSLKFNAYEGNSESVKTVQLRLRELGIDSVMNDKFGRLGDGSLEALNAFRKSKGLEECGCFDEEVLGHLFAGQNVGVQP